MDLKLSGQKVVVIGCATGIGSAILEGFRAEGCDARGFDLQPDPERGITAGSVTDYPGLRRFAEECGPLDHLVFCAGAGSGKFGFPFWNLEPGDWPRVLDINLVGAVNAAHAFAPGLIERGGGSVLFLVSVAGQMGSPTDPPYSAAKAALINFTQVAAKDFAPYGVRANALSPGMVRTPLNESVWAASQALLPEEQRLDYDTWAAEKIRRLAPLGRWQEPPEFAAMAVYLASPHARNITGQTINIDGGQVMHA
jgi:2-hydroxycyclohexanecarboxyl-CoA dehydrogenase